MSERNPKSERNDVIECDAMEIDEHFADDLEGLRNSSLDFPTDGEDDSVSSLEDTEDRDVADAPRANTEKGGSGRKWTEHDQNYLCMYWGLRPIVAIATALGRTPTAIYERAREMGLGAGCPQGAEYLSTAAARAGYDLSALRRILRWANVPVRRTTSHPAHTAGRSHVVEPVAVDAAIAKWVALETSADAARRVGLSQETMARLLRQAERSGQVSGGRCGGTHWHVAPHVVDAIVASRAGREDGKTAARRVGVEWRHLRVWILEAGLRGTERRWWVNPADIDRIVAAKRAEGHRAFRKTKTTEEDTAS